MSDRCWHDDWPIPAIKKIERLQEVLESCTKDLEKIVEVNGCDRGIIYLSNVGCTHFDPVAKCQVYDHENFSPLGDALIALHDRLTEGSRP